MLNLIQQVQLLLTALMAALPLVPESQRARISDVLDIAAKALAAAGGVAANADDLAHKLSTVRTEVEAMAAAGHHVTAEELNAALTRVRTASAAFRAAIEIAEASTP
jgi:hypothetical protein